jgi:hypothetical protein
VLIAFLHPLPAHTETFSRRSSRRNLHENLFSVERLNRDPRPKRCLRNVDRNTRDDVESIALVELVWKNVERDEEITRRTVRRAFSTLPFQADLGSGVDSRRNCDRNLATIADLTGSVECGSWLRRQLFGI